MEKTNRTGRSPRNLRRIIAKRVQQNIENTQRQITPTPENNNNHLNDINTVDTGRLVNNFIHSESEERSQILFSLSDTGSDGPFNDIDISEFKVSLREWAINYNITGIATQELLKLLRRHNCFESLPIDQRTLLRGDIPVVKTITRNDDGSYFSYFGITSSLQAQFNEDFIEPLLTSIRVAVSVDGLPISRSKSKQFWPIQVSCIESKFGVFVAGLYYGETKPKLVDNFLKDLVDEIQVLQTVGLILNHSIIKVKFDRIIADAPARSFIKQCKNHNSYNGCEKCKVVGKWTGRVIFPDLSAPVRTDDEFLQQLDINHHSGNSPFARIDFPLVSCVPIDYMHCICLGVVRKLLRCWIKGRIPYKLPPSSVLKLNESLFNLRTSCPNNFSRKPRTAKDVDMWKATEFRSFLLYTGPAVLKSVLPKSKYHHFLLLSIATSILISEKAQNVEWNEYANKLFRLFVSKISDLYSENFLVYNVHCLIHIAADAMNYGRLDNFSAYDFENNIQFIKRTLRSPYKPFEQCISRLKEKEHLKLSAKPISPSCQSKFSKGNNCYKIETGEIVIIISYVPGSDTLLVKKFTKVDDWYVVPCILI
ncbi:uncharacterized protein LOC118439418 isoform X1 [Folsomia candida]|uniref:uncharacterized protein LOC118439418 isoform X1 n=1 Tax=Folsomia candida TaxID=158441 RepID=UPI0016052EFC|nr:uncharacterized protein LOC118439418 isoform X1 [Folsomia candida]XP_035716609.1 uncharacterized protein LOC118439418 isoform X1 [Folsomia candida]